jgi:type II secretory ATPase GspE/PulE/Tfp pilus assembly ATPase PilB-like protein
VAGALATAALAGFASAQTTIADPESGRFMSTWWLFWVVVYCVAWVGVYDWVGRDSERLRLQQARYSLIMMSVGATGACLMFLLHISLVFISLIGLGVVFSMYVIRRNLAVSEEQRVLTKAHMNYMLRLLAARFHLRGTAGSAAGKTVEGQEDKTTIQLLRKDGKSLEALTEGRRSETSSDAVVSVKELIESAALSRATDIHLEPKQTELQARFRIDGILHNVPSYAPELAAPMVSSIKVLSDMDIAERRKPQDGTFMGRLAGRTLDFRVATAPTVHGETMVIRILDREGGVLKLEKLGLLTDHLEAARRISHYPHGMFIVSGPTGAGKSTTLYAILQEIDAFQRNILTIEDPIEYRLDNVSQTQVNVKAGVTFAGALRSSLRQDPDVIMVGEIRDAETAKVACQAAMTGHLVLSTIHANDSITTVFRLMDLGVEPYFISSSLSAVLAQRLVRVLCEQCKEAYVPEADFLRKIGVPEGRQIQLFKAVGCDQCQGTGYRGRIGIYEMFEVNDAIRDLIRSNPALQLITDEAKKAGMRKLHDDGLAKVVKGITSVKELIRVTK